MWQPIEDVRQIRADHMVEVKVGGVWFVAHTLEWNRSHTLPCPARIGELVRVRG